MGKPFKHIISARASRFAVMAISLCLFLVVSACASTQSISELSQDEWYEARTEHFVVLVPRSAERARSLALQLEEFRRFAIAYAELEILSDPLPFRIIGTYGGNAFNALVGRRDIFGAFDQTYEGGLAVVNLAARAPDGTEDLEVTYTLFGPIYREKVNIRSVGLDGVFHEYVHYLLAIDQRRRYPLWFNEGFAEFLSTFDLEGASSARIGKPPMHRVRVLDDVDLMPVGALLNATGYDTGHGSGSFYAQAWLFVHYMLADPERRQKLYTFLDALAERQVDAQPVLEQVLGMSASDLQSKLRRYQRSGRFHSEAIELAEAFRPEVEVRQVPLDEVQANLATAMLTFTTDYSDAEQLLNAALAADPLNVRARVTLATLHLFRGELDQARELARTAPKAIEGESRILSLKAQLRVRDALLMFEAENQSWPEALQEGRDIYRAALAQNPREAEAYSGYARTFLLSENEGVPSRAYNALDRARQLLPTDFSLELVRGYLLLKEGRAEEALEAFEHIIAWSRTPDLVTKAREVRDYVVQQMDLQKQQDAAGQEPTAGS
ncbi:MAG: tetratricopeptide repeat protein [Alphaproteobacteria bacterium]|nr:tetratricopeptide repeat protein [Alphaproteobacteria bacterium]